MEDDTTLIPENPPGEPSADLTPGTEKEPAAASPSPKPDAPVFSVQQTADMLEGVVTRSFQKVFPTLPSSTSADAPTGPSPAELQQQIDSLEAKIDLAAQEGQPVRELSRQRDSLRDQKFDIERIQPLRAQGSNGINELVFENLRLRDPYFEKYEEEFKKLVGPSLKQGQVLTMEVAKEAMRLIKGRHLDEILASDREANTRQEKIKGDANLPGNTSGRQINTRPNQPDTIKEVFGDRAEEAFRAKKNKGMTEDDFARKQGYADKADWMKKTRELDQADRSLGLDK